MSSKSTKAEVEQRVAMVVELLVGGASRAEIVQFAAGKWAINERQTSNYIRRATDALAKDADPKLEAEKAKAIRRFTALYRKSMAVQDYKGALAAQDKLSQLLGLYPRASINVQANATASAAAFAEADRERIADVARLAMESALQEQAKKGGTADGRA